MMERSTMRSSYAKGRTLEYAVRDQLRARGYVVFRCAGSRPVDLIAIKEGQILLVECKTGKRPSLAHRQLNHVLEISRRVDGSLILAIRQKHGKVKWFRVSEQGLIETEFLRE